MDVHGWVFTLYLRFCVWPLSGKNILFFTFNRSVSNAQFFFCQIYVCNGTNKRIQKKLKENFERQKLMAGGKNAHNYSMQNSAFCLSQKLFRQSVVEPISELARPLLLFSQVAQVELWTLAWKRRTVIQNLQRSLFQQLSSILFNNNFTSTKEE